MTADEALTAMRREYLKAPTLTRRALRTGDIPLYSDAAPGRAYYAHNNTVVYDGHFVGN